MTRTVAVAPRIHIFGANYLNYLVPDPDSFTIEDIARGLAKECRYNGHCYGFYSVAIHSVKCSFHVPRELALQALMHDASEAFVKDIPYNLKRMLGAAYDDIEDRVWRVIAAKYGLPAELDPRVKVADDEALATEKRDLKPDCTENWGRTLSVEPWPESVKHLADLDWAAQKHLFTSRFRQLTGGRRD